MKRLAALLLATSMLAGCSTTAITPDEASSKEPLIASTCPEVPSISKIVVVRDSGILNAAVAANFFWMENLSADSIQAKNLSFVLMRQKNISSMSIADGHRRSR